MPEKMAAYVEAGSTSPTRLLPFLWIEEFSGIANDPRYRARFYVGGPDGVRIRVATRPFVYFATPFQPPMTIKKFSTLLATSFLLVLLQLITFLLGLAVGLVCGLFLPVFAVLLLRFFQAELPEVWAKVLLPTASSSLAAALIFFAREQQTPLVWLAPLLSLALSLVIAGSVRWRSRRCGLCDRRLEDSAGFACPRCSLLVCDTSCWVFEHSRCRLCEQNRVPIFTPEGRWWDRQFGPRSERGRCQLCMISAQEADLRACKKCGRPQCRDCWDSANGQCSRCQWTVEDLPESLRAYVIFPARS